MRRTSWLLALVSAAAVVLAGAAPAGAAARRGAAGGASSGVAWTTCSNRLLQAAEAQCGHLSVPLDYSHPDGRQIELAISRIQHTSSNYQGVIVTNPGGPGGSGLSLSAFLVSRLRHEGFPEAAAGYDWIGFDPRGVGSSLPALSCDPNYFGPDRPDYVPATRALLDYWLSSSRSYAQNCAGHSPEQPALLQHMTTRDAALDMDSIRRALGQPQINYYGFSYGTYLGQVYSTLFPSHVRRLILDSNVDPSRVWYQANLDQELAFNRNENIWFAWLAKYDSVYHLGSTERAVENLFYKTENQLREHPAGGQVGPDEWVNVFLPAGYYEKTWLNEARLFSDWIQSHDAAAANALVAAYRSEDSVGDDNGYAVYNAVQCTDVQWPTSWSTWSADNWAIYSVAPFETWANAWYNAPCIFWPAAASQPVQVDGSGIGGALLIGETLDAATPFSGSLEVRRRFPNSVLMAEPGGTTHADSLSGDRCVDGTIADYLSTGALPPRNRYALWDKTCAPLPVPVPSSGGASAQAAKASARGARRHRGTRSVNAATRLGLAAVELR